MKFKIIIALILSTNISISFASELKLIGTGLLEVTFLNIDVYQVSYYKNESTSEIHLNYKRDVEKKHSILGWTKSLKHMLDTNLHLKNKLNWILNSTTDFKENDLVILRKSINTVSIIKNMVIVDTIMDKDIATLIHEPWIGSKPVSIELKNKLLGNKGK